MAESGPRTTNMGDIKDFPLGIAGFHFSDLYDPKRLKDLHTEFWDFVAAGSPNLKGEFDKVGTPELSKPKESETLIQVGKCLNDFLAKLFNVANHALKLKGETSDLQPIFRFKKDFLNVRVYKRLEEPAADAAAFKTLLDRITKIRSHEGSLSKKDAEAGFSELVLFLIDSERKLKSNQLDPAETQKTQNICLHIPTGTLSEKVSAALKDIEDFCVQVYVDPKRRETYFSNWVSFIRPHKLDFENLVEIERCDSTIPEKIKGPDKHMRFRDGFKLTDSRMNPKQVQREIDYCIYCHQREKDSCTKGFTEKTGEYKKNPLGIPLTGCPLDERISEMHLLRRGGDAIGALAMIMLDNPMCPGTGHRICNDCMKGCIFQKQEPVNIPQNETGVLTDVLSFPYGFEIYSLLTRFNPLNKERPYALPYNGVDILVVGLGPAGYTLAHHLANDGFGVVGVDALKLEPVDSVLTGAGRPFPKPMQNFSEMKRELDERVLMGFGGVSEYGITVRWDKNFLSVIYLSLLRRKNVKFFGGVRFGGTLTVEDAWDLGFKHVALATGAGKPTIVPMKNNLARGIRKASDFLMALQLTGAFKKPSVANLQVRLPAVVIGGGLTAIDTATELMAYYPLQVEKALDRYETLLKQQGEAKVAAMFSEEEKEILSTFLEHGKAVKAERLKAEKEKRNPNFVNLVREWGGVSIAYRKKLSDAPAYRLNHEEVAKALEEGIYFIENISPSEAIIDKYRSVEALKFQRSNGETLTLPARTVCVAAGTSPNIIYERELPGTFKLDDKKHFFKKHIVEKSGEKWKLKEARPGEEGAFFLSHESNGRFVSFYGDNHPDFNGNVVKAMASSKTGKPHVSKLFSLEIERSEIEPTEIETFEKKTQKLEEMWIPRVQKVVRLTPTIVEVVVKGKAVANKFKPGQFYRLQNYETSAHRIDGNLLTMEGLALTGAWVDKEKDLLSLIVLEMGGSSKLCSTLKPGEPVVVMGPTGAPSEIPKNQNVALVGGGLGNAVLLSISRALRANGCKVVYFAGYKKAEDLFKQAEVEEGTDQVVWSTDGEPRIQARRKQDLSFVGNIVQSMVSYGKGELQKQPMIPLNTIDHILVIGSDRMMAAVAQARHGVLKPLLKEGHVAIGSINSPMQCMMKEVCAQCLQRHVDPKTGKESFVFSCFNQDQQLDCVDWTHLNDRLRANSLAEKLVNCHMDVLLRKGSLEKV